MPHFHEPGEQRLLSAVFGLVALAGNLLTGGCSTSPEPLSDEANVTRHSNTFEALQREEQRVQRSEPSKEQLVEPSKAEQPGVRVDGDNLVATGYGDLSKGLLVCQRVADMAARSELAKLIRVTVKQQATDRIRERSGSPVEQDIEIVRQELVDEQLHNVTIIGRRVDKSAGICSSTASMPNAFGSFGSKK